MSGRGGCDLRGREPRWSTSEKIGPCPKGNEYVKVLDPSRMDFQLLFMLIFAGLIFLILFFTWLQAAFGGPCRNRKGNKCLDT